MSRRIHLKLGTIATILFLGFFFSPVALISANFQQNDLDLKDAVPTKASEKNVRIETASMEQLIDNGDGTYTFRQIVDGASTPPHYNADASTGGFGVYGWFDDDFGWRHTFPYQNFGIDSILSIKMSIRAWDIDLRDYSYDSEFDDVYVDGDSIGYLQGRDFTWSVTTFDIPQKMILDNGELDVWVDIDAHHDQHWWATTIDYSILEVTFIVIPPVAEFNSDRNVGIPPLAVCFEDLTQNHPVTWDWDLCMGFSGGHGIHHYQSSRPFFEYWFTGKHDVSLTVNNLAGSDYVEKWECDRSFIEVYGPCGLTSLKLLDHSEEFPDEPWQNAIDGDIYGWDGVATVKGSQPWALFEFVDGRTKLLDKIRFFVNCGVGYPNRWVRDFRVLTSLDGASWNESLVASNIMWDRNNPAGEWAEFEFPNGPAQAKYVKLVIDSPTWGWRQIGEFEVYEIIQLPDPMNCSIEATSPHMANGKDSSTVTLTLKDSEGNPVVGYNEYDIKFACLNENPATYQFGPINEIEPGVYQTTLTSKTEGVKAVVAAAHGAVVGYHKDYGTSCLVAFIGGVYEYTLKLVESSESWPSEPWENAIDGDCEGWDGTATVKGDPPYAIFAFNDDRIFAINKFGIQTDNGTDDDDPKVKYRQAKRIRIETSTSGLNAADFVTVLEAPIKSGDMEYFKLKDVVTAKYIKLTILQPNWGADSWRQIVEFQVHIDAKDLLPKRVPVQSARPTTFALEQNYPNPFNPTTTICYQLPEDSKVVLKVYNTLGQEVATLANGFVEAGYHKVTWDAADVPAGVYIYVIKAGKFSKAARMVLLK